MSDEKEKKDAKKKEKKAKKKDDEALSDEELEKAISVYSGSRKMGGSGTGSSTTDFEAALLKLTQSNQKGCCRTDSVSARGKRLELFKILFMALVPVVALACFSALDLWDTIYSNWTKLQVQNKIVFTTEVGKLVHYLQRERDITALYMSNIGPETQMLVKDRFADVNSALDELSQWPKEYDREGFHSKDEFRNYLFDHRTSRDVSKTFRSEVAWYSLCIDIFITMLYDTIQQSNDGSRWRDLVAYQLLVVAKEDFALERTLGGVFFAFGELEDEDYLWYVDKYYSASANFANSQRFSGRVTTIYNKLNAANMKSYAGDVIRSIEFLRHQLLDRNISVDTQAKNSVWWYDNMTIYIDVLFDVQLNLVEKLMHSPTANIIKDMQVFASAVIQNTRIVDQERRRAESLIYQMLPKAIAKQLKTSSRVQAETFEDTTVFFTDVVGFTRISSDCSPIQVVNMLNKLYMTFDSRLDIYDVHKVETIGDGYMVASGVPRRIGKKHVVEGSMCAMDLQHAVRHVEIPHLPGQTMKIRVGIHTGPVVAGVVGKKMPRYCLFGDTVTFANFLEAKGVADKIQISAATMIDLKEFEGFHIEPRGEISVPDKGTVQTYFLLWRDGVEQKFPCMPGCKILQVPSFAKGGGTGGGTA